MEEVLRNIWAIIAVVLGSSVVAALINNLAIGYRDRRKERKELVAKANASVLRRVELCYRIRRRAENEDATVKNLAHDIQEENEYYKSLLLVESRWYGERYSLYLDAVKGLTCRAMSAAWQMSGDPSITMESGIKLDHKKIDRLSRQFSLDSRRFLCPLKRAWMAFHDSVVKVKKYNV